MIRAVAAAVLLAGCPSLETGAHAIVGGELTTEHEAVVSVWWLGGYVCSGVVVEARTVLTAAHCLYGFPEDDEGLSVRFGAQANTPDAEILADTFAVHPEYGSNLVLDVARIELSEDAPVAPVGWNATALDDGMLGRPLTLVGYGATEAEEADPDRFRRRATVDVLEVTERQLRWDGGVANACEGDSGGAAFDGSELVGLISEGDTFCSEWGAALRLDEVDGWLRTGEAGDDDDLALPDDDDDDAVPVQDCSGCATVPGYAALAPFLLIASRRKRPGSSPA